jgi:hypothetical protein
MNDNSGKCLATMTKTFLFASGELLTLEQNQIEKVSYLDAMVSSADNFKSIYDEHGHLKLDPRIDFKHFSFAIESFAFRSIRQIFTHLPKQHDVIAIIALFDFLGLASQPSPTLIEVDLTFFANTPFNSILYSYEQIIKPCVLQDMAVRFGIAMAKEEYDFSKREVIDQIYWFVMFILCAPQLFGPRLRHHIYKMAEYYFSLFSIASLRLLEKLIHTTAKNTRKLSSSNSDNDIGPDKEHDIFQKPVSRPVDSCWCHFSSTCRRTHRWVRNLPILFLSSKKSYI